MKNLRNRSMHILTGLMLGAWMGTGSVSAQPKPLVLTTPQYTITYKAGYQNVVGQPGAIWALTGVVLNSCQPDRGAPNMDSLARMYGDSLGGHITVGTGDSLMLGKYRVHWQEFSYDSLPKLSAMINATGAVPIPINLKNGKFRVYWLQSDGYLFSVTGLPILPTATTPYADIQDAIKTLVLTPTSIRNIAKAFGRGLWSRQGRLGGEFLLAHPPMGIECFNGTGAFAGMARPSGSAGIWNLPSDHGHLILRMRMGDGTMIQTLARP